MELREFQVKTFDLLEVGGKKILILIQSTLGKKSQWRILLLQYSRSDAMFDAIKDNSDVLAFVKQWIADNVSTMTDKSDRRTALHWAADSGDIHLARLLIDCGVSLTAMDMVCHQTALDIAIEHGDEEMVELLVDKSSSVDMSGEYGDHALFQVALWGRKEFVQLLIDNGASVDAWHLVAGQTTLQVTTDKDVAQLLIDNGAVTENCALVNCEAVSFGCKDTVQLLIDNGASVTSTTENGTAALHIAASGGCSDVVQILIVNGASVAARDQAGNTPFLLAFLEHNDKRQNREQAGLVLLRAMAAGGIVADEGVSTASLSGSSNQKKLQGFLELSLRHGFEGKRGGEGEGGEGGEGETGGGSVTVLRGGGLRAALALVRHRTNRAPDVIDSRLAWWGSGLESIYQQQRWRWL